MVDRPRRRGQGAVAGVEDGASAAEDSAAAKAKESTAAGATGGEAYNNDDSEEKKVDFASSPHIVAAARPSPSPLRHGGGGAHHVVRFSPRKQPSRRSSPAKSWTDHHASRDVMNNSASTPRVGRLFHRSPSLDCQGARTKSWTDQRAPEPFSTPTKNRSSHHAPSKKYGYGNLFRSSSSGLAVNRGVSGGAGDVGRRPLSFHGKRSSYRGGASNSTIPIRHSGYSGNRLQRGNSMGSKRMMGMGPIEDERRRRKPSFTKSDFPLLSPVKPKPEQEKQQQDQPSDSSSGGPRQQLQKQQQASWSAIVGGSEGDLTNDDSAATTITIATATATPKEAKYATAEAASPSPTSCSIADRIPPLPLLHDNTLISPVEDEDRVNQSSEIEVDAEVESEEEEEGAADQAKSSGEYWQQARQRRRAHSFHHYPSNHDRIRSSVKSLPSPDYRPFSRFTTMSISALQNDIGTLLARSNRVEEAIKRYKLGIESAEAALLQIQISKGESGNDSAEDGNSKEEGFAMKVKGKKCPKVTEAEGLAWFRQKLLRGDVMPAPASTAGGGNEVNDVARLSPDSPIGGQHHGIPSLPPPPPFFQPAGFGGCAPKSPRRLRSSSFSVVDLHPEPHPPRHLGMPCIGQSHSGMGKADAGVTHQAPQSPIRPSLEPKRISCPVTAPHPGKPSISFVQQPRTPQLSRAQSARSASFGIVERSSSFHHRHTHAGHHIAPLDDIVHDIHQHQKLDCPDEVYSCNGLTPLGMEYICDPLPVLGCALRSMIKSQHTCRSSEINNGDRGNKAELEMMETASLIASRLNLASLEYRLAGGGVGERLQEVLKIIELALEDCEEAARNLMAETDNDGSSSNNIKARKRCVEFFRLLRAVAHSNMGAVKYRLKRVRESLGSFEAARAALADDVDDGGVHARIGCDFQAEQHTCNQNVQSEPHDDNRFPQRSYLLLAVRLNLSRVLLRLNRSDEASKLCHSISEDNKPHRRNASLRILGPSHHGFRRSNSFSAASSALETATKAYEHDIDRRSKWLGSVSEHYIAGLISESKGEASNYKEAWHHYNRLLSLARVKLDHRHPYVCALLERRGAVLFEQRRLQCSMLSYLACLKILEHQQSAGSNVFNEADLSRVLYAVARVLHDKEEYHDAIHMYQRALACQRSLAAVSGRPSLDVVTTLCNISRVHHLCGEIDEALATNREVLDLATMLVGGNMEHPFLIHRLKVEGNMLVEAGRLEDAMSTFVDAARRCGEDGRDRMVTAMMGGGGGGNAGSSSQEDADAGDSSVLSIRSAAALAQINFFHPAAASA